MENPESCGTVVCAAARIALASMTADAIRHPRCDPDTPSDDYPRWMILEVAVNDCRPDGCSRSFQPGSWCPLLTDTNTMLPYGAELTLFWLACFKFVSLALAFSPFLSLSLSLSPPPPLPLSLSLSLSVERIEGRPIRIAVQPDRWLCLCPF